MAGEIITGVEAQVRAYASVRDRLLGLPLKGSYVTAKGNRTPIPESWDGDGSVPVGWRGYRGPEQHPTIPLSWSCESGNGEADEAVTGPRGSILTGQERALIQSRSETTRAEWLSS